MTNVAEVIAAELKAIGTEYFFCLTGGDQALWIALQDAGIRIVNCRSEQSATYLADGYARARGGVAFVYGQAGPGTANVAGALAEPYWAQTPIVSLTSSSALETRHGYTYQEIDQLGLHGPVTRWSAAVGTPQRTAHLLRRAIRVAQGIPSGPVHLELPGPFFDTGIDAAVPDPSVGSAPPASTRPAAFSQTPPDPAAITALADAIEQAQRPAVLAGRGVIAAGAEAQLLALASRLALPVLTTPGGKGAFPEHHPLACGVVGRYASTAANETFRRADVILAIGTRLGSMATDTYRLPAPGATLLHVDLDPDVIGNNFATAVSVLGDAKATLAALSERADAARAEAWGAWSAEVRERNLSWRKLRDDLAATATTGMIQPGAVIAALRRTLDPEDLLFADTGYMAAWCGVLFPVTATGRTFHRAAGSLGWAFSASLGGALARPDRRVACVSGDGGFGYHVGDLETALRHNINATIVIINNQSLAFEYHIQKYHYGGRVIESANDYVDVDYGAVARAFGAWGRRVTQPGDLDSALREAHDHPGLAVLDVVVDKEAIAPVTVYDDVLDRRL